MVNFVPSDNINTNICSDYDIRQNINTDVL